jgi:Fe-S cluster biogenesis protein NfuA
MVGNPQPFEARMQRIEQLIEQIERSTDPKTRDSSREIIGTLLEMHGAGLKAIFSLLTEANGGGHTVIESCLRDDLVRSLLLLHDLHPESLEHRVGKALEKVRPYLHSHGGNVELLEVSPDVVRLRMEGSCHGCPSSAATLRDTIERTICEFAPDVTNIQVEGLSSAPAGLVELQMPQAGGANRFAAPARNTLHLASNGQPVVQET